MLGDGAARRYGSPVREFTYFSAFRLAISALNWVAERIELHLPHTDWSTPRPGSAEELLHTRAQLRHEQEARFVAEASTWRLRRMQALLAALAGADSPLAVARALLEHALPLFGAAGGCLHLVRDGTEMLELLYAAGYP